MDDGIPVLLVRRAFSSVLFSTCSFGEEGARLIVLNGRDVRVDVASKGSSKRNKASFRFCGSLRAIFWTVRSLLVLAALVVAGRSVIANSLVQEFVSLRGMASGLSVGGGESRCYSFWLAFKKCMLESPDRTACTAYREDYEECLHHRKAIKRFNTVVREFQRRETAGEKLPRPEEVVLEPSTWTEAGHAADIAHERQGVAGSTESPQSTIP